MQAAACSRGFRGFGTRCLTETPVFAGVGVVALGGQSWAFRSLWQRKAADYGAVKSTGNMRQLLQVHIDLGQSQKLHHCITLFVSNISGSVCLVAGCAQVLSDDNKRAIYDKFGEAGLKGDAFGGMGGMGGFQAANPMDIFESFFGSGFPGFAGMGGMDGMGGRRERAGENEQYELQIDFLDAVFGCKKELEITHLTGGAVSNSR